MPNSRKRRLNIKAPNIDIAVAALSGGNQQKIVPATWLSMKPKMIIFDAPTRGVDVSAKRDLRADAGFER